MDETPIEKARRLLANEEVIVHSPGWRKLVRGLLDEIEKRGPGGDVEARRLGLLACRRAAVVEVQVDDLQAPEIEEVLRPDNIIYERKNMLKKEELANENSCLNKARDGERLFVLLGRDRAAPFAIRAWCAERVRLGKNHMLDAQIQEAMACANLMEQEQLRERAAPATTPDPGSCDHTGPVSAVVDNPTSPAYGTAKCLDCGEIVASGGA